MVALPVGTPLSSLRPALWLAILGYRGKGLRGHSASGARAKAWESEPPYGNQEQAWSLGTPQSAFSLIWIVAIFSHGREVGWGVGEKHFRKL